MTYKEAKEAVETVNLLEKDLMRDLTDEEKDLVVTEGYKKFFEALGIDDDEYKLIRRIKDVIGTYMTDSTANYMKELEKDNTQVKNILEHIIEDIKQYEEPVTEEPKKEVKKPVEQKSIIDRLVDGEQLQLFPWEFQEVVEWLDKNDKNYSVLFNNGVVSLKLL